MPSACELARLLATRELSAESLLVSCLERVAEREPAVRAWAHLDPALALREARELDRGPLRGVLHGLPFGVKDIIDTADYPTECGTPIYAGRRPHADAACVAAARRCGGLLLGKTVTTELAYFFPGKTMNPVNPAHTPGGSSSGSAAAVAAGMVPLAVGTQSAGSVVRPAAFCGVVGYKPSFGLLSRAGVKMQSDSLDTLGVFARSVADAALFVAGLALRPELAPLERVAAPRVGLARTFDWPAALPETAELFEALPGRLGRAGLRVTEVGLPAEFAGLTEAQKTIMSFEDARGYAYEWNAHRERLSEPLARLLEEGLACPPAEYEAARALARRCRARLAGAFREVDVLLTPAALGEAPEGLSATGDPVFSRAWTLLGVPVLGLPAGFGPRGLPLGVQVIGKLLEDRATLAAAAAVEAALSP